MKKGFEPTIRHDLFRRFSLCPRFLHSSNLGSTYIEFSNSTASATFAMQTRILGGSTGRQIAGVFGIRPVADTFTA